MGKHVQKLVDFATRLCFEELPEDVVHESKRILLDSIGCALAGLNIDKGRIAVQIAKDLDSASEVKIIGTGDKVSVFSAIFANGELITALDYDALISPPGHVSPYVIPSPLAVAEKTRSSGKSLICALAAAHEVSARFGRAMADVRDVSPGGKISFPPVTGYSSAIFGGTLATSMLFGLTPEKMAHALGLAGHIAPAQAMAKWVRTLPATTDKYLMAGWIGQAELLAVLLAERGYKGDIEVLEGDYGFWRYMGSARWTPEALVNKLGEEWWIPRVTIYKPYPHCRISQTVLDCLKHLIEGNQFEPEEIERVNAYCDPHGAVLPMWSNKDIRSPLDAQMSVPYGVSCVVHRIKNGPEWQDLDTLRNEKIISFMDRVTVQAHPEFEKAIKEDPASRIGKAEIIARGKKYSEERRYRKGSPATPQTRMTDEELVNKFKHNAARFLTPEGIEKLPNMILRLEDVDDISDLAQLW